MKTNHLSTEKVATDKMATEKLTYETLKYEDLKPGIAKLSINRPSVLNALNDQVLKELDRAIHCDLPLKIKAGLKVLILTGEGGKAFVAGADIRAMHKLAESKNEIEALQFSRFGHRVMSGIESLPIPVIAQVNGFALGGGLELALACDFIYASEKSKFGLPEVSLGLIPGFGGTQRLTRAVGVQRSREIIYSGQVYTAAEALSWGLINRVLNEAEIDSEILALADTISSRGPKALGLAKFMINEGGSLPLAQGTRLEADSFSELFKYTDTLEGMAAFIEKRKPLFTGN